MSSLILVTCDSGAGHLKLEKLADRVLTVTHRLVSGPIPFDSAPEHFFLDQRRLYETEGLFHEPWWFEVEDLTGKNPRFKRIWSRLPEVCLQYDTITLWIDPDANAQLILLQLLDWLGQKPEIASRLWLKQAETPTGDRRFGDLVLPPTRIESADVALASRAWAAFRSSTPRAWAALEEDPDIARLPGLKRAVRQMLGELPDSTGLGATQRKMLALVERQSQRPELVRRGGELSACALPEAERGPERLIIRDRRGAVRSGVGAGRRGLRRDGTGLFPGHAHRPGTVSPFPGEPGLADPLGPPPCRRDRRLVAAQSGPSLVGRHQTHQRHALALGCGGRPAFGTGLIGRDRRGR
jgi:hypothetical protein